jgi:hypothetical protein
MPKRDRVHRSELPDSCNESESSESESDAESTKGSRDEATPVIRPKNPSIDIRVTTKVRHAKASKSGLEVATTTTPGKPSFYHSISFWASEIKEAQRTIKSVLPYKWAYKANGLSLNFPKVYYQTKGANGANMWIKTIQHRPNRYCPVPEPDSICHHNIKISFEADFTPTHLQNKAIKTTENTNENEENQAAGKQDTPGPSSLKESIPPKSESPRPPVTAEIMKMAKEEALEIQIKNFLQISYNLRLKEAMYQVTLKLIEPINALSYKMDTKGKTKQVFEDFVLQSKMFQANLINYLRNKPVTPPSLDHIPIDIGQQRIGEILRSQTDIKSTFLTTMKSLNMHTDLYTSMFDYTSAFNIINCMADDQRTEPICNLKKHFEENIIKQVHNTEFLQPELPQINNPEVEYLPNIITKIRDNQLVTHIHNFANDFATSCKSYVQAT